MLLSNECSYLNSKSFTVQKRHSRSILALYPVHFSRPGYEARSILLCMMIMIKRRLEEGLGMRLETGGSSYPASRNGDEGEKYEIDGSIRMVEDHQRYHCH